MKALFMLFWLLISAQCFAVQNGTGVVNQISANATVTSTLVLSENLNRAYLLIQNNGAASVIVKFGSVQSGSEGIIINAGGNYEPFMAPKQSLYVKSSTGTQAIVVLEGI